MSVYDPHDPANQTTYALSADEPAFLDAYGERYVPDEAYARDHAIECWTQLFIPVIREERGYQPKKISKSEEGTVALYEKLYLELIGNVIKAIAYNTGAPKETVHAELLAASWAAAEKEFDYRIAQRYEKKKK